MNKTEKPSAKIWRVVYFLQIVRNPPTIAPRAVFEKNRKARGKMCGVGPFNLANSKNPPVRVGFLVEKRLKAGAEKSEGETAPLTCNIRRKNGVL